MSRLLIDGGKRLSGSVDIGGAKNSVLPILAATLLIKGVSVIKNCPRLSDVEVATRILTYLGCVCKREEDTVVVDARYVGCDRIPDELMREMRSSVMFLGPILARCKSAVISNPGGCELGPRPIDLHLKALRDLGYDIDDKNGYIICSKSKRQAKSRVHLAFPSVGATENVILATVLGGSRTVITGAAKEPEIVDLIDFLTSAGAKIYGGGTDTIEIIGVEELGSAEHSVIPDRIVAATYISAAAVTFGEIELRRMNPSHLTAVINAFCEMGVSVRCFEDSLVVKAEQRPRAIPLTKTLVYPGFPTDAGPLLVSALCLSKGCSVFVETIFENRFRYIDELIRFGADIRLQNKVAVIEGVEKLVGASVNSTDLRGGAAMVVAALGAEGKSEINDIYHIERGYEDISRDLKILGANIKRED